ncbi:MAG TPA: HAMP domain-containing sensor histidine kinase [Phnomibacter sp.]|nr:HAMP domain-containing sensor histidine kinase [Phnomibacter sp.]
MTKKLLYRASRANLIVAVFILLISAPVFYWVTEKLYIEDADEALLLRKEEFLHYFAPGFKKSEIAAWNKFNRDFKIEAVKPLTRDTLFYNFYYDSLANENEPYRELNAPIVIEGEPYTYTARINLVETNDLIRSIGLLFLLMIALLMLGWWYINKRYSQQLWAPFYQTLAAIEQFELDKAVKPTLNTSDVEEFNRLNESVEKLIEKNLSIYQSQKEFVENAAHELQTPLAVFQAKIDALLQYGPFTEEQFNRLVALHESAARLKRLNKNLLLLSKIDNDVYHTRSTVAVKEIIEKQLEFFCEQAQAKQIDINTSLGKAVKVQSNSVLLELMVSNLFMNAVRHNIAGGKIYVALNQSMLRFSNTGKPHPLGADKLFTRFSKVNASEQGNGLGLAIVKKITELNSWRIAYEYADGLHQFSVYFE